MRGQAKPFTPRRRRPPVAQTVITVRGRGARHVSRALAPQLPAAAPLTSPAFRYRYQMVPVLWGATVAVTAMGMHEARLIPAAVVTGGGYGAVNWLLTRHLKPFARKAGAWMSGITALRLPLVAAFGPKPSLAMFGICWAAFTFTWARHYRIRQEQAEVPNQDEAIWAQLAEHKHWHGHLGKPQTVPNGVRYPLRLDGVRTHIGDVTGAPLSVAAAWHKTLTEAYVEPSPDGVASRGYLTILKHGTLQQVRHWNGQGVTGEGFAVISRFAEGADARIRVFAPMDGARHSLIAGTTGAGKSELLSLLLHIYLTSGFIYPVVLDPQEGQSLPDWQDQVPYAAGIDECMEMLTLLHQAMFARSRALAKMTWDDDGHTRRMNFFDRNLTGWPLVRIVADEMHMLLTGEGKDATRAAEAIALVKDIGKLGRKTGTGIDLVTQVPSLEELGSQVLRAMLRGGNVICLRTADSVSGGMMGLPADPSMIPQYFPDGSFTYGLGYVLGPDRRQAIARTDLPTAEQRRRRYQLPELERGFAGILSRFGTGQPGAVASASAAAPGLSVVAQDESPAPGGQTAADAVLAVLTREMIRGELIKLAQDKSLEWGRTKPFSLRAITTALKGLAEEGRVARIGDIGDGRYAPARASLSVVGTHR